MSTNIIAEERKPHIRLFASQAHHVSARFTASQHEGSCLFPAIPSETSLDDMSRSDPRSCWNSREQGPTSYPRRSLTLSQHPGCRCLWLGGVLALYVAYFLSSCTLYFFSKTMFVVHGSLDFFGAIHSGSEVLTVVTRVILCSHPLAFKFSCCHGVSRLGC